MEATAGKGVAPHSLELGTSVGNVSLDAVSEMQFSVNAGDPSLAQPDNI